MIKNVIHKFATKWDHLKKNLCKSNLLFCSKRRLNSIISVEEKKLIRKTCTVWTHKKGSERRPREKKFIRACGHALSFVIYNCVLSSTPKAWGN